MEVAIELSFVYRGFSYTWVFFKLNWILNFLTFKWLFLDNATVPPRTLKALLHISNSVVACFARESLSERLYVWLLVQMLI